MLARYSRSLNFSLAICAMAALPLAACGLFSSEEQIDLDVGFDTDGAVLGPDGLPLIGSRVGESCASANDCRSGLTCSAGVCAGGEAGAGSLCTASVECGEGLVCGLSAICEATGGLTENATCSDFADCEPGLRCNLSGFSGSCQVEGTVDAGQACSASGDCLAPLMCSQNNQCAIPGLGGLTFMPEAACVAPNTAAPFRSYFEVPGSEAPTEFYRLPFPNDARVQADGSVSMAGFHNPGLNVIGGDLVDRYVDAVESNTGGFSTNPTIFFRFNESIEFDSLRGGDDASLYFVNITPDSPDYGLGMSMSWAMTTGRGNFICNNYVSIRPSWQSPLRHGETYAVYLTDDVRSAEGDLPVRDADFEAVMAGTRPSEPRLGRAWDSYEPLRDYFTTEAIPDVNVMNATVFTTMDPDAAIPALRNAVRARSAAPLENLANCSDGDTSPCAGPDRGCVNNQGDFTEIHATYRAPIFQAGTRPYLDPEDGGNIEISGGSAVVQGEEEICVSLTIPNGAMPEGGWPVVMYGHGTGGDFTSHIGDGTAGRLANIDHNGTNVQFVSVSIDGAQHGPRRGDTELEPEPLFFNFTNPNAARGNTQQGAADYFVLTQVLENVNLSANESPTGEAINIDPNAMYFFGHSQGSTVGAPFVAYEPAIRATIFSGAGGSLTLSLLNKTEPVNIAEAVGFVLNEEAGDNHPFLSLLQWYIDPVDSLNYGRLYFRELVEGGTNTHIFQSFGVGDSYSPDATMNAFAGSMGLPHAVGGAATLGLPDIEYDISGNRGPGGSTTAALISYQPEGYDGHFVVFRDGDAVRQSMSFLASDYVDGIATIPQ